ncbi:MAG: hypothetical protein LIO90_09615 [Bacteroidales bacterium]|nr:hypothetical protein [Bacteroidales bacterium]
MKTLDCYQASARFTVSMPQLPEDVPYDVELVAMAAPEDTLLPCSYLIDWELTGRDEPVKGFTAYYDGNHYRFSGERLQEYHIDWDGVAFAPGGKKEMGVQRTAQFVAMLPQVMALELESYESDPAYRMTLHADTLIGGAERTAIEVVRLIDGVVAMEGEYVFDKDTSLPLRVHFENSPGTISEQSVDIRYTSADTTSADCASLSEEALMERYPQEFEMYRQSNYRIENLPGHRLPGFALPTTTGERYARRAGESFRAPTIVAILEGAGGYNKEVVESLRKAVDSLPMEADVIWAFVDTNIDRIEGTVGQIRPGEHLLMSARGLARDCGVASFPVIVLTRSNGVVGDVVLGYNNDLTSSVIQKMALLGEE